MFSAKESTGDFVDGEFVVVIEIVTDDEDLLHILPTKRKTNDI